eukprot:gene8888-18401_t
MQKQKDGKNSSNTPAIRSMECRHKPIVVLRCKLVVVGDAAVGKTSLTQVFQTGGKSYPKNYMMTCGAEFGVKQISFPESNAVVELYIFDCAGQSIFNQYENASAVLVVYDVSNLESLQSCAKWASAVREQRPSGPRLGGVLVGNKADYRDGTSDSRAEVVREDAQRLASELGLSYFETSAANNTDVEAPFRAVAEQFYQRYAATVNKAEQLSGMNGV